MMSSPYSPLKIFHHRAHLVALARGNPVAPIHTQILPTNVCNSRCSFCAYRWRGYSSNETFDGGDSIPFEKLIEIVADCETMGVRAIEVTGGGEPTCHPQFLELCRLVLDSDIDLGLVTNGVRWSEEHTAILSSAKWIRFSIDSGCRETYAAMRKVPSAWYDTVRAAIRSVASTTQRPLVGVGFTVTLNNWQEVVRATERAREDGADNIRISAVFQPAGLSYFDSFAKEAGVLCRDAEELQTGTFRVFNLFTDRLRDLFEGKPDYPTCNFQKVCSYIGADQNLYRCCVVAYNRIGLLGSLKGARLRDVWFSDEVQAKLANFDPNTCPTCMFHNKNRTIAYAIDPNPQHVNFP